jgi:hemerythrin
MDDQHGILVDTLNEARMHLVGGKNQKQLNEHIERLIEFTRLHFSCEESLLERHGFPGLAEHRAEHEQILTAILTAGSCAENDEKTELHRLLSGLSVSYLQHIEAFDRQYGSWLNELGIY